MNTLVRTFAFAAITAALAGCDRSANDSSSTAPPPAPEPATADAEPTAPAATAEAPVDAFLARIAGHCGQAFAGRIVADQPPAQGDDPFTGKPLLMHVRECGETELKIPFHVGDDHSRTW